MQQSIELFEHLDMQSKIDLCTLILEKAEQSLSGHQWLELLHLWENKQVTNAFVYQCLQMDEVLVRDEAS
ncbi:hypothetical protein [Shewanella maritima]|uniref:hypothetical protein n=1 Tax=Shewanella maritima TaxID=2520507 RepID=UPI0037368642